MSCIVQKFGGTSVASPFRLKHVAQIISQTLLTKKSVVVVSAMAGVTNQLASYIKDVSSKSSSFEHDVVLSSGEQVTAGLLALALEQKGIKARSFLAWQLPVITSSNPCNSAIQDIDITKLLRCLDQEVTPIIAGFQGIDLKGRLTTLGRGGSDTTAVALSHFLKAERCDIFTDVDGVYSTDPIKSKDASFYETVTYDKMIEMAYNGAKVLHPTSVEWAKKHNVPLRVLSTFHDVPGTNITPLAI